MLSTRKGSWCFCTREGNRVTVFRGRGAPGPRGVLLQSSPPRAGVSLTPCLHAPLLVILCNIWRGVGRHGPRCFAPGGFERSAYTRAQQSELMESPEGRPAWGHAPGSGWDLVLHQQLAHFHSRTLLSRLESLAHLAEHLLGAPVLGQQLRPSKCVRPRVLCHNLTVRQYMPLRLLRTQKAPWLHV